MHATPVVRENLYGVRTTYGTHPRQPRRIPVRLKATTRHVARGAKAAAVAALAAWYFVRPPAAAGQGSPPAKRPPPRL